MTTISHNTIWYVINTQKIFILFIRNHVNNLVMLEINIYGFVEFQFCTFWKSGIDFLKGCFRHVFQPLLNITHLWMHLAMNPTPANVCLVIPSLIVVYLSSYYIHIFWLLAGYFQIGGSAEADIGWCGGNEVKNSRIILNLTIQPAIVFLVPAQGVMGSILLSCLHFIVYRWSTYLHRGIKFSMNLKKYVNKT